MGRSFGIRVDRGRRRSRGGAELRFALPRRVSQVSPPHAGSERRAKRARAGPDRRDCR
jgi:hypothetical protein